MPAPIDRRALDAALKLFVATFVVADKRTQIHDRLLVAERRAETLATLPRWLVKATPLEGADQSPVGLRARFGELAGVYLAAAGAQRTAIADAVALGRATPALFIADNGSLAVITTADGPPVLCSRF